MQSLPEQTRRLLLNVSTASISTLLFKRGLRNTCLQGVRRMSADQDQYGGRSLHVA
jgi:hypothetical protein